MLYSPLNVELEITEFQSKTKVNIKADKISNGKYTLQIPIGKKYIIMIAKKGYKNYNFVCDLYKPIILNNFEHNIVLQPNLNNFNISVTDTESNEIIAAIVNIKNLSIKENQIIKSIIKNNGQQMFWLRENNQYYIEITGVKGYTYYMKTFTFDKKINNSLDIKLSPLTINMEFELYNIDFEKKSSYIKEKSYNELNHIAKLMIDNPTIKLEIVVFYYNNDKSDIIKKQLSKSRAEAIVNYLINNNISNERLVMQSYITPPATISNTKSNEKQYTVIIKIIGL